jgi:hypothetical protein
MFNEEISLRQHTSAVIGCSQTTKNVMFGIHIMGAQIHPPKDSYRRDQEKKRTKTQTTFMALQY